MWADCKAESCRPCRPSDPTSDTVKFDPTRLPQKENVPTAANRDAEEAAAAVAAKKRDHDQQLQREHERAEQRRQAEAKAQKLRAEAEAERVREQRALENARIAAAEQAAAEQERQFQRDESARRMRLAKEQEEQRKQEEQANKDMVDQYLKDNGYGDVNSKRKKYFKYKYPLHSAVKEHNVDMVRRLLRCDADPTLTNSAGQTPRQLAEAMDARAPGEAALADVLVALPSQ
jgi:hypothetical protein